jgi:NAD(P)-dependent dehydrogenase (short-subunit alcohol dehydrogenase family)
MAELSGKVAICTGGAQGIGRGTAEKFLEEGARVVIADVHREQGEATAAELGPDAAFKQTDVSDEAQVQALVDFGVERFGGLDIMFNNAGISGARHAHIFDDDFSDFHKVMSINLLGVIYGTKCAGRYMADHGGGSIINITSIGAFQASPSLVTYAMSKQGVIMFSQSAAIDLGQYDIRVNCIAPGNIETPILGNAFGGDLPPEEKAALLAKMREFLINRQPLKRQGKPSDIGEAATFFGSDRSAYITGTVMPVDAGMSAGSPPANNQSIEKMREDVRSG